MIHTLMWMLGYVPETHLTDARRDNDYLDRRLTLLTSEHAALHRRYTADTNALTDAVVRVGAENERLRVAMRGMMARGPGGRFFRVPNDIEGAA
jgi:hypothetical protein